MNAEVGMVTAELSKAILQHAASACSVTPGDLIAGRSIGRVLEARHLAIWITSRLFRDWDAERIGRAFNRNGGDIDAILTRVRRRRAHDPEWRAKGDRVLSRVLMGQQAVEDETKSGEEPLSERDVSPAAADHWGFKERWSPERFQEQNERFVRAMIAAGYRRTSGMSSAK